MQEKAWSTGVLKKLINKMLDNIPSYKKTIPTVKIPSTGYLEFDYSASIKTNKFFIINHTKQYAIYCEIKFINTGPDYSDVQPKANFMLINYNEFITNNLIAISNVLKDDGDINTYEINNSYSASKNFVTFTRTDITYDNNDTVEMIYYTDKYSIPVAL